MPEQTQHEVGARIQLTDGLSTPLRKIGSVVSGISSQFDKLSVGLAGFTALGGAAVGAFSLHKVIEETNEHMRAVSRISTITGLAAEKADGMVEAFEKVGIEGTEAERILLMLSRTGAKMADNAMGMAMGVQSTADQMKQLGIDVTKGPQRAMEGLATAVQRGQMDMGKMMRIMGIRPAVAVDLMRLLKQGPEHVKNAIEELEKSGTAVTAQNLAAFKAMQMTKNEVITGWKRVLLIVGRELYPVIDRLMKNVQDRLPAWIEGAKHFGAFLRDHLETAVGLAKTLGKVMMANALIAKATAFAGVGPGGQGVGMGGLLGMGRRFVVGGAPSYGTVARVGNVLSSVPGLGGLGGFAGMGKVTAIIRVVSSLARISVIGLGIAALVGAFQSISSNFMGIRDFLGEIWGKLRASGAVLLRTLHPVLKHFGPDGMIGKFFLLILPLAFGGLMDTVSWIIRMTSKLIGFIGEVIEHPGKALRSPIDTWNRVSAGVEDAVKMEEERARREQQARNAAEHKAPGEREAEPYYDFRNSRFDIKQNFAEGLDPDRIAVAFANDLAMLGERRLQSGFAPIFAVR